LQETLKVGSPEVFKAGTALAGGVARQNETCGALTGAIMGVCCLVGREKLEDRKQYNQAMDICIDLVKRFREKVGHSICAEIHKIRYGKVYRLHVPEERKAFHDMGGHSRTGCPEVCGIAARIAGEIILEIQDGKRK
jgi:C_GCAxxG_C_C family probable redox protein